MLRDLQVASEIKINQRIYFWLRPNVFNTQFIFGLYLVWFHALFLFIKENVQLHYYIHIFYFVPLEKDLKTFCFNCKIFFVCVGVGPGFCSPLKLSFVAIVI